VKLKGGEPAGDPVVVDLKERSPDDAAAHALARLTELAMRFEDEATPYRSLVLPMWSNRYGTYDDLARVKEWSAFGDVEEFEPRARPTAPPARSRTRSACARSRPPTRRCRPSFPPMRAPARPTSCRSA